MKILGKLLMWFCKTVNDTLIHESLYLYRGVIQEKDVIACEHGNVTFRYQHSKTKQIDFRTVTGETFLWMLLQHVLPKGFRRTRNFGFLHPNSKRLIQVLQLICKLDPNRALAWIKKRPHIICKACGGVMVIVATCIHQVVLHVHVMVPV